MLDSVHTHISGEGELKAALVLGLQNQAKQYESQRECATAWKTTQPTINYIVNAKVDRLTVKQLLGIAWKSGATINIGLNY